MVSSKLDDRGGGSITLTPNPALPPSPLNPLCHLQIQFDDILGTWKSTKRPKTRRRSILRKWEKTRLYFEPDPNVYVLGGILVGHPTTVRKLIEAYRLMDEAMEQMRRRTFDIEDLPLPIIPSGFHFPKP